LIDNISKPDMRCKPVRGASVGQTSSLQAKGDFTLHDTFT